MVNAEKQGASIQLGMTIGTAIVAGMIVATIPVVSQTRTVTPDFEVASVKLGDPNNRNVGIHTQRGPRFTTTNTSLKMLIQYAYDVRNNQIVGGPSWVDSEAYNIEARAAATTAMPNFR